MSKDRKAIGNPVGPDVFRVQLLGPYRISASSPDDPEAVEFVSAQEFLGAKPAALLAFLLLHNRPVERIELARLFWPDSSDERARHSLREALRRIRRAVGGETFLRSDPVELDGSLFQTDVDACLEALQQGDIDRALSFRSGPLLGDLTLEGSWGFEEWKEQERRVVDGEMAGALHARAAGSPPNRDPWELLQDYLRAVEIQPFRQMFWADAVQTVMVLDSLDSAETLLSLATEGSPEEIVQQLRSWLLDRRHGRGEVAPGASKLQEREEERQHLRVSFQRVQRGHGSVLSLVGPPGIGKTSLLDWVEEETGKWPGMSFVRISARPVDQLLPWSLAGDLISALSALPGASGTSQGSDEVLSLLRPSLKRRGGPAQPNGSLDSGVYVAAFADATADLLGAVSAETPLVLAFDDIHEMDRESQELLVRLSRGVARLPVVLVFTADEVLAKASVLTGLQNGHAQGPIQVRRLKPLSLDAIFQVLSAADSKEVEKIGALSGGIPGVALAVSQGGEAWERTREAWKQHIRAHEDLGRLRTQAPPALRGMLEEEEARRAEVAKPKTHRRGRKRKRRWALGIGLPLSVLALWAVLNQSSAPLYGGGEIHLRYVDGTSVSYSLRDQIWTEAELDSNLTGNRIHGPYRSVSGADLWVETTSAPTSGPDAFQVLPGGGRQVIYASPGDDTFQDVSPDGRFALIVTENQETPAFDRDVVITRLEDGETRRLFRSDRGFLVTLWSRDGTRILVQERGIDGELVVLSPSGEVLQRHNPGDLRDARWCGPEGDILFVTAEDGRRLVSILDGAGDWRKVLAFSALWSGPCSPDGSAFLAWVAREGDWVRVLLSTHDGSILEGVEGGRPEIPVFTRWYGDSEPPVPTGVEFPDHSQIVPWGGRQALSPRVSLSNGTNARPRTLEWESADPSVASVTAEGEVIGNRPGSTWVVATASGWLSDSVQVNVEADQPSTLLLYDSFPNFDGDRWKTEGAPAPIVESSQWLDRPTLHLNGDGQWFDGILSQDLLSLPRGGVLEVEFRMPVTRKDRQNIQLCLAPEGTLQIDPTGARPLGNLGEAVCVLYPAGELSFFQDRTPTLRVGHWQDTFSPVESLPSDDWIVLGISVRPDGFVSAEVNRVPIGISSLRIPGPMPRQWQIGLFGKDVDTRLEVRGLALWDGAREDPGLEPDGERPK